MNRTVLPLLLFAGLAACSAKPHSMTKADECLKAHDLACAAENLEGHLERSPSDMRATAVLGIIMTQTGHHERAIELDKKAIDGGLKDPQLYANYAGSLEATDNTEGAIAANKKALELDPTLVDVAARTAMQLNQVGRPAEGVQVLEAFDRAQTAGGHPAHFEQLINVLKENVGAPAPLAQ